MCGRIPRYSPLRPSRPCLWLCPVVVLCFLWLGFCHPPPCVRGGLCVPSICCDDCGLRRGFVGRLRHLSVVQIFWCTFSASVRGGCGRWVRLCRVCGDFAIPRGCMLKFMDWFAVGGLHVQGAMTGMDQKHTFVLLSRNWDWCACGVTVRSDRCSQESHWVSL